MEEFNLEVANEYVGKVILLTDVDGTMVSGDMKISSQVQEALDRWMNEGQYFSLSTGRGRTNAEFHLSHCKTNFPAIFANGVLLYDREKQEAILEQNISTEALAPLFERILAYDENTMIQLYTKDQIYLLTNSDPHDPRVSNHQPYVRADFHILEGMECNKILLGLTPETADGAKTIAEDYIHRHRKDLRVVKSQAKYIELQRAGVSKGSVVKTLKQVTKATIAVAGDYYNDMEMLKEADISFTLASSPKEVQDCADVIFEATPQNFLAQVVDHLEAHVLKKEATQEG